MIQAGHADRHHENQLHEWTSAASHVSKRCRATSIMSTNKGFCFKPTTSSRQADSSHRSDGVRASIVSHLQTSLSQASAAAPIQPALGPPWATSSTSRSSWKRLESSCASAPKTYRYVGTPGSNMQALSKDIPLQLGLSQSWTGKNHALSAVSIRLPCSTLRSSEIVLTHQRSLSGCRAISQADKGSFSTSTPRNQSDPLPERAQPSRHHSRLRSALLLYLLTTNNQSVRVEELRCLRLALNKLVQRIWVVVVRTEQLTCPKLVDWQPTTQLGLQQLLEGRQLRNLRNSS